MKRGVCLKSQFPSKPTHLNAFMSFGSCPTKPILPVLRGCQAEEGWMDGEEKRDAKTTTRPQSLHTQPQTSSKK